MGDVRFRAGRRQFGARSSERFRPQYLIEQLARGRIRIDAEFAAQDLFALVIGAQRAGAVVIAGVQANQHLVVRLGQRIERHQPFGVADGRGIIAAGFEQDRQAAEHMPQLAAVVFALGLEPVVVEAAQQVVLVEARGFFQRRRAPRSASPRLAASAARARAASNSTTSMVQAGSRRHCTL